MTVGDCIRVHKLEDRTVVITYRMILPDGTDIFAGACVYKDGGLTPVDHDNYSLGDEVVRCLVIPTTTDVWMDVWYESEWEESSG